MAARVQLYVTPLVALFALGGLLVAVDVLTLGLADITLFVIVLFWDTHRLEAIGGLAVLYLGLGVGIFLYTRSEAARGRRLFASTVEHLRKDREHFVGH